MCLLYLLQLTFFFDAACRTDASAPKCYKPLMYVTHNTAPQFRYVPHFQFFNLFRTVASLLRQKSLILLRAIKHVFEKIAQVVICFDAFRMQRTWGDRGTVVAEVAVVSARLVSRVWIKKPIFNFWISVITVTRQIQPLRCAAAAFTLLSIIPAIQSKPHSNNPAISLHNQHSACIYCCFNET